MTYLLKNVIIIIEIRKWQCLAKSNRLQGSSLGSEKRDKDVMTIPATKGKHLVCVLMNVIQEKGWQLLPKKSCKNLKKLLTF